jgi:hypothetical protein
MWKASRSSLVKCKSKFLFLSLPHYLIFILGMAFCPQARSGRQTWPISLGVVFGAPRQFFNARQA